MATLKANARAVRREANVPDGPANQRWAWAAASDDRDAVIVVYAGTSVRFVHPGGRTVYELPLATFLEQYEALDT